MHHPLLRQFWYPMHAIGELKIKTTFSAVTLCPGLKFITDNVLTHGKRRLKIQIIHVATINNSKKK